MLTTMPKNGHTYTGPFDQTPNAETAAHQLGGRKAGQNDWRIPHLCAGAAPGDPLGDNPGLSVGDGDKGLIVFCHYGCDNASAYTAVRAALGINTKSHAVQSVAHTLRCPDCLAYLPADRLIPGTGWPALSCSCGATYDALLSNVDGDPWTAWAQYLLADGNPRLMVRRFPQGQRKTTWAAEPPGPDGKPIRRPATGLHPLTWGDDTPDATLLVVEGEKAAAALISPTVLKPGYTVISTQSAAGMATADYDALVAGRHVIIWSDADPPNIKTGRKPGPEAAQKAADRILDAGALSVRMVDPDTVAKLVPDTGKRDGADAADVRPGQFTALLQDASEYRPHIQEGHAPTSDTLPAYTDADYVDLIMTYQPDRVVSIGVDLALRTDAGLWRIYDHSNRRDRGLLTRLVRKSRVAAGDTGRRASDAAINSIVNDLHDLAAGAELPMLQRDTLCRTPIVPFSDGTHLHLDAGQNESCSCNLDNHPWIDFDWQIPPPDWDLFHNHRPDVLDQFDENVLTQVAERLHGPDKRADFLTSPASDAGKSSFTTACSRAMPGLIQRLEASELNRDKANFSVHSAPLACSRITFLDEFTKNGMDITPLLYGITDDTVNVNTKHEQQRQLPRLGTPIFVGDDEPTYNSTAQGIPNRIGLVWRPDLRDNTVDSARRDLWLSPQQLDILRAWMLALALQGPRHNDIYASDENRLDSLEAAIPDPVLDAREACSNWDPTNGYTYAEIRGVLVSAGAVTQDTCDNDVVRVIKDAWPRADSKQRRQSDGTRPKLWVGINHQV